MLRVISVELHDINLFNFWCCIARRKGAVELVNIEVDSPSYNQPFPLLPATNEFLHFCMVCLGLVVPTSIVNAPKFSISNF
jgi:hypothetical protein